MSTREYIFASVSPSLQFSQAFGYLHFFHPHIKSSIQSISLAKNQNLTSTYTRPFSSSIFFCEENSAKRITNHVLLQHLLQPQPQPQNPPHFSPSISSCALPNPSPNPGFRLSGPHPGLGSSNIRPSQKSPLQHLREGI